MVRKNTGCRAKNRNTGREAGVTKAAYSIHKSAESDSIADLFEAIARVLRGAARGNNQRNGTA